MSFSLRLKQNHLTTLTHLSLWVVFLGAPIILEPADLPQGLKATFDLPPIEVRRMASLCLNIGLISFFYLNYAVLLPRFYLKGRLLPYLISIALAFCAFHGFSYLLREYILSAMLSDEAKQAIGNVSTLLSTAFFVLMWAASSGFRLGEEWRRTENARRETERARLEAELSLLKSQINPHFFLNSLNNLYALALTDPDKMPPAILKLSEMVAYILYECDKPRVPLSRDLQFLENYITLQRLRLPPNVVLNVEMPPSDTVAEHDIEPMLLISFVENAFKHGLTTRQHCEIGISVKKTGNVLHLHVENDILPAKMAPDGNAPGIGLANTRQRLEHSYPARHVLSIDNDGKKHRVRLVLDL